MANTDLVALADELTRSDHVDAALRVLARRLARDELFDHTLYQRLSRMEKEDLRPILVRLSEFEVRHIDFWKRLGQLETVQLTPVQRLKLVFMLAARRLLGSRITLPVLEAIEHYGIQKYVNLWDRYREGPIAEGIRIILMEELQHEDEVVTEEAQRQIRGEDIRNIVLGLNDGLVEVLGSVGGFFAAFRDPLMVAVAASIVSIAGAISMGAGAYVSVKSEREVQATENAKQRVLEDLTGEPRPKHVLENPWRSAVVVAIFYILGALVPVLPFWLGAQNLFFSVFSGAAAIALASALLAALSGVPMGRKILENVAIALGAAGVTYLIGSVAKATLGIEIA